MSKKVLTTKFNYSIPTEELKKIMPTVAIGFSEIPGCCWKIWLFNEDRKEAGGVYLFETASDLEKFLESNLFASVTQNKLFSNFQIHSFSISMPASIITGAPLRRIDV